MTHTATESATVRPYVPTTDEIKRGWQQTAEGIYVAPHLATDEDGKRIVKVNWYRSIDAARAVSRLADRTFYVASYGEELDAIKANAQSAQEANSLAAWTRNRYQTVKTEDGRMFTRIFSHGPDLFADLETVLTNGYIAGLRLGAPAEVSGSPNPDFLNAYLHYGDNPVLRGWYGRLCAESADADDAAAYYGALSAGEALGFRLVHYTEEAKRRMLKEHAASRR